MFEVDPNKILIDLEGVAIWELDAFGAIGGTYKGKFKFRTALSPIQEIDADRDYRELLGKNSEFASGHTENLAYILAQLKYRVLEAPPFWNDGMSRFPGGQVKDIEILELIMRAAVESEGKFRKSLKEKHKQSLERLQKVMEDRIEQERLTEELEKADAKVKTKKAKTSEKT